MLVDRAPLPPHERPWRHPSELAPTRLEIGHGGHHRAIALATGTLAVMMMAALVVAMTPARTSGPAAVSATTTPADDDVVGSARKAAFADIRRSIRIASFTAIPNAIAAVPSPSARSDSDAQATPGVDRATNADTGTSTGTGTDTTSATRADRNADPGSTTDASTVGTGSTILPDLDEQVLVLTDRVAYAVPWRDVAWLSVEGDAIVLAGDGSQIARFEAGRLIVTSDALVGSAVAVTGDQHDD